MRPPDPAANEDKRRDAAPPRRRRPSLAVQWGLAVGIGLAVLVVGGLTWLVSEHALRTIVGLAVEHSGGRLAVDNPTGTLAGRVHADRIAWRDEGTDVAAEDVLLRFSPAELLHGKIAIDELAAKRLRVGLAEGDDTPIELPDSLAPPLAIDVDRLAIGSIALERADGTRTISDFSLAYSGDARGHRVRDLKAAIPGASVAGGATVGARRPFDVEASVAAELASPYPDGRVEAAAKGTLEALVIEATSSVAKVPAQARVEVAPLAPQPLVAALVRASGLDLSALDASLPATKLDVAIEAKPAQGGFAGTLQATNAVAGPLDAKRVPLARLASSFALREGVLALDAIVAQVPEAGTIRGGGTVELDGWRNRWKLDVKGLDLARLHSALIPTSLDGRLEADVEGTTQTLRGDVAQQDLALAFEARHDGESVVVPRFAAKAQGGSLAGSGRVALAGARPFVVEARADGFDPSRFGAFPAGTINGTIRAEGSAADAPFAQAEVTVVQGSRLAGLPLQARVRGRFDAKSAEGLEANAVLGATRLAAKGAINRGSLPLAIEFASTDLAQLAPLLPRDTPAFAGRLEGRIRVEPRGQGAAFTVDARGENLRYGDAWSFASLRVAGRARHDAPLTAPKVDAVADVDVQVTATGASGPQGRLDEAKLALTGSAASHTLALTARSDKQAIEARTTGAVVDPAGSPTWRGLVETLVARGVPGFDRVAIAAPVDVEVGAGRVVAGPARIESSGAVVDVDGFAWRDGRLETRGSFRRLPVAPIAGLAGLETRWPMDLTVGGRWDVASAPEWRGTLSVSREGGDVYVDEPGDEGRSRRALGVSVLEAEATIAGPRLAVRGEVRAKTAGDTIVDATIEAPSGRTHPFDRDARLGGGVRAHLPSLATLQPWVGTAARVRGRATADINLAGTLGDPAFDGQVVAYGLEVDMPQYGVNLDDGRLRVVSGNGGLKLEEFVFTGGAGRFTATGTIALPTRSGATSAATKIDWRAQNFRALNHPDRRLVLDGEGTLSKAQDRWTLAGRIAVDEGSVTYLSTSDTKLADDIVVVGRPRPKPAHPGADEAAVPLDVDLAIELGRDLRISAEGLETRLAGKLQLASTRGQPLVGKGTIRTVRGTYYAFGQKLTIDRGRVIFDGPITNPALDIVALRKNLAVEAGVEITGTVRAPVVKLTSQPPVPDNEKLSWLLTGGPPGSESQQELVALQAAQAALVGKGGKTITQSLAQKIGLDEVGLVQRGNGSGDDFLAGQAITVGKRINDRVYVTYEQGLQIVRHVLRLEYVLSRYFTASVFSGTESGVELRFRRNWR